jgi:hypothetical protein
MINNLVGGNIYYKNHYNMNSKHVI